MVPLVHNIPPSSAYWYFPFWREWLLLSFQKLSLSVKYNVTHRSIVEATLSYGSIILSLSERIILQGLVRPQFSRSKQET